MYQEIVNSCCWAQLSMSCIYFFSFSFAVFRVETSVHRHDEPNNLIDFCSRLFSLSFLSAIEVRFSRSMANEVRYTV